MVLEQLRRPARKRHGVQETAAACARAMAEELVAPTAVAAEHITDEVSHIVDLFKAADPAECQRWLANCFRSFPDFDHVDPYLPLLPNATDIGKCLLLLAAIRWVERLDAASEVEFAVAGIADGMESRLPCHIVVCPPQQRLDAVARASVVALERQTSSPAAVGFALGGIGDVEPATTSFSVARGSRTRSAARGGGLSIGWIDGNALFATFALEADGPSVREGIRHHLDEAITRAIGAAT